MDVVEAESGHLDRADQAEDAVIKHLRGMGNELLTEWGAHKENQNFQDARKHHPEAMARKKNTYWLSTYEKIELSERCLGVSGHRVRPFSEAAHIHCRDYSLPLQRRIVDFAADASFATVTQKMKEHYDTNIPESSAQAIALHHARNMKKEAAESLQSRQECVGEGKQLIGEIDGSMIPVSWWMNKRKVINARHESSNGRKRSSVWFMNRA
ncbi:hypothetical protein [Endozoicomonas sp.]|uniref:hypothetical protein n=1 Tax=Endozoicomonas sp. TaxID=1892382 RepID=UPI00383AD06F